MPARTATPKVMIQWAKVISYRREHRLGTHSAVPHCIFVLAAFTLSGSFNLSGNAAAWLILGLLVALAVPKLFDASACTHHVNRGNFLIVGIYQKSYYNAFLRLP